MLLIAISEKAHGDARLFKQSRPSLEIENIRSQKHESNELRDILFRGVRCFERLLMLQPRAFIKRIWGTIVMLLLVAVAVGRC